MTETKNNPALRRAYRKPELRAFGSLATVTRAVGVDQMSRHDHPMPPQTNDKTA